MITEFAQVEKIGTITKARRVGGNKCFDRVVRDDVIHCGNNTFGGAICDAVSDDT